MLLLKVKSFFLLIVRRRSSSTFIGTSFRPAETMVPLLSEMNLPD